MSTPRVTPFTDTLKQLDQALTDWESLAVQSTSEDSPGPTPTPKSAKIDSSHALEQARLILEKLKLQIQDLDI